MSDGVAPEGAGIPGLAVAELSRFRLVDQRA